MGQLLVHEAARVDVQSIASYIAQHNLGAALRFVDAAEVAFDFLASTPGAGPKVTPEIIEFPDLRSWPITPFRLYLVLYRPISTGVEIFRVIHGQREFIRLIQRGR